MADDRGSIPTSYLLKDDPYVKTVVESGETLITRLDRTSMGASLRSVTDEIGQHRRRARSLSPSNEELHGIFQIDSQGTVVSEDLVVRCRALANVVELALANAIAHQELEIQANTDPLTGLSNRRGLSLYLDGDRRLNAMSILVLDIDHLKAINDAHGHEVGRQDPRCRRPRRLRRPAGRRSAGPHGRRRVPRCRGGCRRVGRPPRRRSHDGSRGADQGAGRTDIGQRRVRLLREER